MPRQPEDPASFELQREKRIPIVTMAKSGPGVNRWPLYWAVMFALALVMGATGNARALIGGNGQIVGIGAVAVDRALAPGANTSLIVTAQILPGWHINSDQPLDPAYIATRLSVRAPQGIAAGAISYPASQTVRFGFSRGEKLSVFSGNVSFRVPLIVATTYAPQPGAALGVTLAYQACNDLECLPPTKVEYTEPIRALAVKAADSARAGTQPETGSPALAREFHTYGYTVGFLLVLLAGFGLNLTPCIYPLIGVTLAFFGFQGGAYRKTFALALLYVLGIALTFSGLGAAVAVTGGLFGSAMQNPYVLATVALLMVVLAASSFGWFVIQPPHWLLKRAGAARPGYAGALIMGMGMGVVAAPCIGPIVLGLMLMVERSQSPILGFALFFTLALGMGAPYVGLALAAGSIRQLPRSGEWLCWVEHLFGFILIGLAIYYVEPLMPPALAESVLPLYAAAAGIYMGFLSPRGRSWRPFMVVRSALGLVSAVALVWILIPHQPSKQLPFSPFSREQLARATGERRPVLVDFSARWCIPCREMDQTTFRDRTVLRAATRFVALRADLTADNERSRAIIREFEIRGVPTTVLVDSHGRIRKRVVGYIGPHALADALAHVN